MGQTLYPTAIVAKAGLGGLVTDIDDDPASPDGNWCTSGSASTFSGSGAGTLAASTGSGAGTGTAEDPLFFDDFASGDVSKNNSYFHWYDSSTPPSAGAGAGDIFSVTGPDDTTVNAFRFTYGTWQEIRYRMKLGSANGYYPVTWISADYFVPTNYETIEGGVGAGNDKLHWQGADGYQIATPQRWFNTIYNAAEDDGSAHLALSTNYYGGLWATPTYVNSSFDDGTGRCLMWTLADRGTWVNVAFMQKYPSGASSDDGEMRVYKNGVLIASASGFQDTVEGWDADQAGFDRGYFMGYHNSPAPDPSQVWYMTNVKFGTTAAQVGITE
jgi:hypothetical protein